MIKLSKNLKILSKKYRKIKRVTLEQLAEKTNHSEPYLSQLENGTYSISPRLELIQRIQNELNIECIHDLIECNCSKCKEHS